MHERLQNTIKQQYRPIVSTSNDTLIALQHIQSRLCHFALIHLIRLNIGHVEAKLGEEEEEEEEEERLFGKINVH